MFNISLICTRHNEGGNCNSSELLDIIAHLRPEVIFEELSLANYHRSYEEKVLSTLETNAIKKYLRNNNIVHVPVDTFPVSISHEEDIEYLYSKIFQTNISASWQLRNLLTDHMDTANLYGFPYLNGEPNDNFFDQHEVLKQEILAYLNNEKLFRIDKTEKEVINLREDEILNNIYEFSEANSYNQAIFFIGSGHRKSIIEKIKNYENKTTIELNWGIYNC